MGKSSTSKRIQSAYGGGLEETRVWGSSESQSSVAGEEQHEEEGTTLPDLFYIWSGPIIKHDGDYGICSGIVMGERVAPMCWQWYQTGWWGNLIGRELCGDDLRRARAKTLQLWPYHGDVMKGYCDMG